MYHQMLQKILTGTCGMSNLCDSKMLQPCLYGSVLGIMSHIRDRANESASMPHRHSFGVRK